MKPSSNQDSRKTILRYLALHGVRDKDAAVPLAKRKKHLAVGRTRRGGVRKTLDLHGMTTGPALAALRDVIDECSRRGLTELLVVHGYGLHSAPGEGGVLRAAVRQYLESGNARGYEALFLPRQKRGRRRDRGKVKMRPCARQRKKLFRPILHVAVAHCLIARSVRIHPEGPLGSVVIFSDVNYVC